MSEHAVLRAARPYLDELEERLRRAVSREQGVVSRVALDALDAGGKRLRPLLVHLTAADRERALLGGVAVELVHTASLVHDDLIDGAELRRGRAAVWHAHGANAARTAGDYLFARAFAGEREALQRRQLHDPDTTQEAYVERISLKSAKLFEVACRLGSRDERLGAFGLALGIAFQIADDILDCSGDTIETGKIAGTDLREGTPTLPLILAAREDPVVRAALAGGPLDGAILRVAATGALERSREVALDYARTARDLLHDEPELEALTHIVVERRA